MQIREKTGKLSARKGRMTLSQWQLWSMMIIPIILIFIFCYIPMGGIIIAFKDYKFNLGILGSKWVGLANFEYFFKGNDFWRVTRNTLSLNFLMISIGMVCAVGYATLLFETVGSKNVKVYQTIAIVPNFISWVIVGYISYTFLHPQSGLVNRIIELFGGKAIDWYSTPKAWPAILTLFNVWKCIGMDSVIYYATLMGIDSGLYEASALDGANKWQQFIYITLPQLSSVIIVMLILKIGGIFRSDFGLFYQLTRDCGVLYETTDVMDTYIYRTMRVFGDMSTSSAMGLLQSVVGFVMVIITNTIVSKVDSDKAMF